MNQTIAIDGPAGAGKSTIAKRVSNMLGYHYVDTGAMYRTLALALLRAGISEKDEEAVKKILVSTEVRVRYEDSVQHMILNGEDVTHLLRKEEVGDMASRSSTLAPVREKLLDLQQQLAESMPVVMDGRDIGTVVVPDALLKIYLTASVAVRAQRRYKELVEKGETPVLPNIEADIRERDERDMNRPIAPLRQAEDAYLVDSSDLTIEEVCDRIIRLFYGALGITIAENAGFCFGVRRAVRMLEESIENGEKPIRTLGPIIHNETVVRSMEEKGVITLKDGASLPTDGKGTVVIRSHGVGPDVSEKLRGMGYQVVDATCPFVQKIHEIVRRESKAGRLIILIGDPAHPENIGTLAWAEGPCISIASAEEAKAMKLPKDARICVVAQTTFDREKFKELVEIIGEKEYDMLVLNTICHATDMRQTEAAALADSVDMMLVVGSRSSSNTQKLYDICKGRCACTSYIQSLDDLVTITFRSDSRVGITAGASTPNNIIQEVAGYVRRAKF